MPFDPDRLDRLIAESEQRITLQILRIAMMEMEGRDTSVARRALKAFEGILVEYRHARTAVVELRGLAGES